jgi:hypothetical protein
MTWVHVRSGGLNGGVSRACLLAIGLGVLAVLTAGCGGSSTGSATASRHSSPNSGSDTALVRCVNLWNSGAANARGMKAELAGRDGQDRDFHFKTRVSVTPTREGCVVTILQLAGFFQFAEAPEPGVPQKRVFFPVNGGHAVRIDPRMLRWNVTIDADGSVYPLSGSKSVLVGDMSGVVDPAPEARRAILNVVTNQPEVQGVTLRDVHLWVARSDRTWALVSFEGFDAQGQKIGAGLDLMHLTYTGWQVFQGPGTSLDSCRVPTAVRHVLGILCP